MAETAENQKQATERNNPIISYGHSTTTLVQKPCFANPVHGMAMNYLPELPAAQLEYSNPRVAPLSYPEDPGRRVPDGNMPRPEFVKLSSYWQPYWDGGTWDPKVPFAITCLAEKNLPYIDFSYTFDRIPNLHYSSPYPDLSKARPLLDAPEDPAYEHTPKESDDWIKIGLFPLFYKDGRHCIGYRVRGDDPYPPTLLFTPCSTSDLRAVGLFHVREPASIQGEGSEPFSLIGSFVSRPRPQPDLHTLVLEEYIRLFPYRITGIGSWNHRCRVNGFRDWENWEMDIERWRKTLEIMADASKGDVPR